MIPPPTMVRRVAWAGRWAEDDDTANRVERKAKTRSRRRSCEAPTPGNGWPLNSSITRAQAVGDGGEVRPILVAEARPRRHNSTLLASPSEQAASRTHDSR